MKRHYSLPFKSLVGNEVELKDWHYRANGGDWLRVTDGIPGWDYLADVELSRDITVDGEKARSACGLRPSSTMDLVIGVHCPASRFRQIVATSSLSPTAATYTPVFRLPSAALAEYVQLETEIVLRNAIIADSHFAPRLPGSRLFSDTVRIELEGKLSRMPVEAISFTRQLAWLGAPKAPWFVSCDTSDLQAPVMRVLRLYLNTDQPSFLEAAEQGQPELVSLIGADVAAEVMIVALQEPDFVSGSVTCEAGSLGEAAARLLSVCFPHYGRPDVATLAQQNRARFHAAVRSCLVTGHE